MRIGFELPLTTHRNLIEPVTGRKHLYVNLLSRFVGFLDKVKKSSKIVPKILLSHIMSDVRSTTGSNLRKILIEIGKDDISKISRSDILNIEFAKLADDEKRKVSFLTELLDLRSSSRYCSSNLE